MQNIRKIAARPFFSCFNTFFQLNVNPDFENFENFGINAGTKLAHSKYSAPNLRRKNCSSANIILS